MRVIDLSTTQRMKQNDIKKLTQGNSIIKNGLPYFTGPNVSYQTGQWYDPDTNATGYSRKSLIKYLTKKN